MNFRYRMKPLEVEAVPVAQVVRHAAGQPSEVPAWAAEALRDGKIEVYPDAFYVHKVEVQERRDCVLISNCIQPASLDDMLVLGSQGVLYACSPDTFAATYEEIA